MCAPLGYAFHHGSCLDLIHSFTAALRAEWEIGTWLWAARYVDLEPNLASSSAASFPSSFKWPETQTSSIALDCPKSLSALLHSLTTIDVVFSDTNDSMEDLLSKQCKCLHPSGYQRDWDNIWIRQISPHEIHRYNASYGTSRQWLGLVNRPQLQSLFPTPVHSSLSGKIALKFPAEFDPWAQKRLVSATEVFDPVIV